MKKQCSLFIALLVSLSCLGMGTVDRNDLSLVDGFENPPQEAKPWVYWFWMNGNITREGITADLEAMDRVGIGGVLIMENRDIALCWILLDTPSLLPCETGLLWMRKKGVFAECYRPEKAAAETIFQSGCHGDGAAVATGRSGERRKGVVDARKRLAGGNQLANGELLGTQHFMGTIGDTALYGNYWVGTIGDTALYRLWEQEVKAGRFPPESQPTVWPINQNIALLGMSGDRRVLPAILEIADSMKLNNPPRRGRNAYEQGRTDWSLLPWYNRIINICFAVEQMPDRSAVRSLTRFLDDPYIGGNITLVPEQATWNIFPAILESRIAATLARCGEKRGFEVLVEYLNDLHYVLVDYAHRELCSMLPRDYGYDYGKWKKYMNSLTFPVPMVARRVDNIEL